MVAFYTALLFSLPKIFRASGEAILGTLKYFSVLFYTATAYLRRKFFRASGEAILGTQRYFNKALYTSTVTKHFTQALYQSTLSKHFIKELYQGITRVLQRYYKGITNIFVQPTYRGEVLRSLTSLKSKRGKTKIQRSKCSSQPEKI